MEKLKIEMLKTEILIPYSRNSRTHSSFQVQQIAGSIKEFGFTNPILIDEKNMIIAGHGRIQAAQLLKLVEIPCIRLSNLSDVQKRAYTIADNKLALNAGWDDELLSLEISELINNDYEIDLLGFTKDELKEINKNLIDELNKESDDDQYSKKIDAPTYQPEGPKPPVDELYDSTYYQNLINSINDNKELNDSERLFLIHAASRHIVFNYQQIAEFYAHSNASVQKLMEDSALVIIDFNKALENGFVKLTQEIKEITGIKEDE
jgi:hypothetical protein